MRPGSILSTVQFISDCFVIGLFDIPHHNRLCLLFGQFSDFLSNQLQRFSIDTFFHQLGITPRVIMEADDTEAIKRLVESGFGYSILPEFSLHGQSRFLELFRVAGHRLVRRQALAMPRSEYPRPLTQSIAGVIHTALVGG